MRSHNDWAALKKAELMGWEKPGTYDRLREEAEGHALAEKNRKADEALEAAKRLHAEIAKNVVPNEPKTWGKKWAPK